MCRDAGVLREGVARGRLGVLRDGVLALGVGFEREGRAVGCRREAQDERSFSRVVRGVAMRS